MRSPLVLVAWLCSVHVHAAFTQLGSDAEFEERVLGAENCWAVLFTSDTRVAESQRASFLLSAVAPRIPGLAVGEADVDAVKAVASEFNVRKRMVPRIAVFTSRARQAEFIKLGPDAIPNIEQLASSGASAGAFHRTACSGASATAP